jgi:acyl carrier protein
MDSKTVVRQFLDDNMLMGEAAAPLGDDVSFLSHNLLDSTGVLELVEFLEDRFGIAIDDAEIVPANLDSLSLIAAFIERKQGIHVQAA